MLNRNRLVIFCRHCNWRKQLHIPKDLHPITTTIILCPCTKVELHLPCQACAHK